MTGGDSNPFAAVWWIFREGFVAVYDWATRDATNIMLTVMIVVLIVAYVVGDEIDKRR